MELFIGLLVGFLFLFLQIALVSVLVRWIFRIDRIVEVLEQTAVHLEDIKQQNDLLINQQDEIIGLLEADTED